jgi:hypothetical protein
MARSTRDLKGQDKTRKLANFKPEGKVNHITKVQQAKKNGQEKQEPRKGKKKKQI